MNRLNKIKSRAMQIVAVLISVCILSSFGSETLNTLAASHTHAESCYPKCKHVHVGDSSKQGGCYSNIYDTVTCGTGYYDSSLSKSYSTGESSGYTEYYGRCNTCGSAFYISTRGGSPSGSYGSTPQTGVLYTHKKDVFRLACGMNETSLYAPTKHVHEGVPTTRGGCYQGAYSSVLCANSSTSSSSGWTHVSTNYDAVSYCGSCGGKHGPGTASTYKCNTCGTTCNVWGGYSTCQSYQYGQSLGQHYRSSYAVSCGKSDSSFYDSNGNVVSHMCNKVVTVLLPKK